MDEKLKNKIILSGIMIVLVLFNLTYYPTKFFIDTPIPIIDRINSFFLENKTIFLLFEFIGVSTLLVDSIVTIDKRSKVNRTFYIGLVSVLFVCFVLRIIFSYMDASFGMP